MMNVLVPFGFITKNCIRDLLANRKIYSQSTRDIMFDASANVVNGTYLHSSVELCTK